MKEIKRVQIRKRRSHHYRTPLESNLNSANQSPTEEITQSKTEMIVNPEVAINPQPESLHHSKWKKEVFAVLGCAWFIGYAFHKHYQHDLNAFVLRLEKDNQFTQLLQFFRILPKQDILRDFEEYSYEMYCERLSYYLIKRIQFSYVSTLENPLGWKCMQDAVSYFNAVLCRQIIFCSC